MCFEYSRERRKKDENWKEQSVSYQENCKLTSVFAECLKSGLLLLPLLRCISQLMNLDMAVAMARPKGVHITSSSAVQQWSTVAEREWLGAKQIAKWWCSQRERRRRTSHTRKKGIEQRVIIFREKGKRRRVTKSTTSTDNNSRSSSSRLRFLRRGYSGEKWKTTHTEEEKGRQQPQLLLCPGHHSSPPNHKAQQL